ncbi:MAG: DNA repair exonuclease [Desulfovibrio sp.]|jgi:DNA repair exonuclease SbcCD nuclease subunit|nr:DNA repair exonuclease [Desulfovibrio sp.]
MPELAPEEKRIKPRGFLTVRYIHAADLHLDTAFYGIADARLAKLLRKATFTALDRLVQFCESEKPDFLVLAGDIYNQEDCSIKAQLALRDACLSLQRAAVRVFLAHGNHDPLSSRLATVALPDNVTVFGTAPESHVVEKQGAVVAVVHGISHERAGESKNLASLFSRNQAHDCFQLGVLHCAVTGQTGKDRNYAPCSVADLRASGLDAWALGHVHERCVLSPTPFIAYCGNAQGLHINEEGDRGCLLVTVGSTACESKFLPLGQVQWKTLAFDLEGAANVNDVEARLTRLLKDAAAGANNACADIVARVTCTGCTALDAQLRNTDLLQTLKGRLAPYAGSPNIWLKDFRVETSPEIDREQYLLREDLLGCTLQRIDALSKDRAELQSVINAAIGGTPRNASTKKHLAMHTAQLDDEQRLLLLREAERLCITSLARSCHT